MVGAIGENSREGPAVQKEIPSQALQVLTKQIPSLGPVKR